MTILFALLQNMRPKQWTKNGFVFAGLVFDQQLTVLDSVLRVLATFALLCLTASSIYIINDLVDLEKDRQHPKKKFRPLASGRLPVRVGVVAAVILSVFPLAAAFAINFPLGVVIATYWVLHVIYSFVLKNIVILDVFAVAAGFILRVLAGIVVLQVEQFSPWLYVCAGLLSLFLAVGKRRQELMMLGDHAVNTRKIFEHYNLDMLNDMLRLTMASAAVAYTLYAIESETTLLRYPEYMLLTIPFVYYGLFRYMYVIYVQGHGGDPTEVLFEDRPLQVGIGAWGGLIVVLLYLL